MLVAQNSLGPVCPVPLTVRGTVRRELAIPTVCVYGAALPYDWSTCAKGQNPSSLLVGSPRLLFLFTIFLSWRSEPLNLLRPISP